jgi:cytochrome P450
MNRIQINASTLIIAGSETTATLLSGVTYLLLANPSTLEKLTDEVRTTFKSDDEITLTSVGNLTYMLACLNEAMRRYPPVPIGLPRAVPKGGATIAGLAVPENVSQLPALSRS